MKLICRFLFRGLYSPFNPGPPPRVKVPSLLSHRGSVSELLLVSHTLPIHWFHWRNKRSVSYYSSRHVKRMTSQIRMEGNAEQVKNSQLLRWQKNLSICLVPIINIVIYFRTETTLGPRGFVKYRPSTVCCMNTNVYCVCTIDYNIQPRLTLLKVCRNIKRSRKLMTRFVSHQTNK